MTIAGAGRVDAAFADQGCLAVADGLDGERGVAEIAAFELVDMMRRERIEQKPGLAMTPAGLAPTKTNGNYPDAVHGTEESGLR